MNLRTYLRMMDDAEHSLAGGFRTVADGHRAEPDVYWLCRTLADQCENHRRRLEPIRDRYREEESEEQPDHLETQLLPRTRPGPVGLLRDLQDLYTLACFVDITWTMLLQAAYGLRDRDLIDVVERCDDETKTQVEWLRTRMKNAAPQALIAAR